MAFVRPVLARRAASSTALASPRDFILGPGRRVGLKETFLAQPEAYSPYALDFRRGRLVLVRMPSGVDPAEAHPFFYAAQRRHAEECICADFAEVHALAEELGPSSTRFVFLYSAGRSGSTVAGRLAHELPGVDALSEPDVFAHPVTEPPPRDRTAHRERVRAVASTARLLAAHRAAVDPARRTLLVKQRGLGIFGATTVHAALPEASALVLQRPLPEVVDSYLGAFLAHPVIALARRTGVDRLGVRIARAFVARTHGWVARTMPDVVAPRGDARHGVVELMALAVEAMNAEAARLAEAGVVRFGAPLAYATLVDDPRAFARGLAERLGLRADAELERAIARTAEIVRRDAQRGSSVASQGRRMLDAADLRRIEALFERSGVRGPSDVGVA